MPSVVALQTSYMLYKLFLEKLVLFHSCRNYWLLHVTVCLPLIICPLYAKLIVCALVTKMPFLRICSLLYNLSYLIYWTSLIYEVNISNSFIDVLYNFFVLMQFISSLKDNLNAEVALGTVTNVKEACAWLGYTYLFIRMKMNPLAYGIGWDEVLSGS